MSSMYLSFNLVALLTIDFKIFQSSNGNDYAIESGNGYEVFAEINPESSTITGEDILTAPPSRR
jgi:hypothetical protein